MNIIINESLHNRLQKHIICTIQFGSEMKGYATDKSDKDYLHIIESADWWVSLPVANQHLFQYKEDNVDHIYCNAHTFIKSILDGDTTIFIEMHRYGALNNTCLSFLSKYNFTYYRTIRAYLGVAKRDIKDIKKLWKSENHYKMNKKFKFVQESINLVINELTLQINDVNKLKDIYGLNNEYVSLKIKTEELEYSDLEVHEHHFINLLDKIRNLVNEEVQSGELKKTLDNKDFIEVIKSLSDIEIKNDILEESKDEIISLFYNSYVSGF